MYLLRGAYLYASLSYSPPPFTSRSYAKLPNLTEEFNSPTAANPSLIPLTHHAATPSHVRYLGSDERYYGIVLYVHDQTMLRSSIFNPSAPHFPFHLHLNSLVVPRSSLLWLLLVVPCSDRRCFRLALHRASTPGSSIPERFR